MAETTAAHSGDGSAKLDAAGPSASVIPWSPPNLLNDVPATADEFGGGHARLARSLAGMVRDEPGGRAIALTGPYGSGKSTVVQLAEAILPPEVAVFTFDAWAHSGDPLRRSFIEELVTALDRRDWTSKEHWDKDLLRLSRRHEETKVTSSPRFTWWGGVLAFTLLLVPLGMALLSRNEASAPRAVWGFVVLLAPIAVIVLAYGARAIRRLRARRTGVPIATSDDPSADLLPLLVRERHTETSSTTIRTPDPTTVEFEDVFRRVVGHALRVEVTPERRLVVVVDNLDRLSKSEASSAWGVMRTFFDGTSRDDWERRLWVVTPIALDAVPDPSDAPKGGGGEELIAKTFAATLRVPPPVLSEWRDFFTTQLSLAFPYWARVPGEHRAVYDLFLRLEAAPKGQPPTPRSIKTFVNRLVALDRQWQGDIPLRTLALYLLVGQRIKESGAELRSPDFLTPEDEALVGTNWRRFLAAVHFNVEPEKADQVLIGGRIETALETGDPKALDALSRTPGLGEAVLSTVRAFVAGRTLADLAVAADTLSQTTIERSTGVEGAWEALVRPLVVDRAAILRTPLDLTTAASVRGLGELVGGAPPDLVHDATVTLIMALSQGSVTIDAADKDPLTVVAPADWVNAAAGIVAAARGRAESALTRLEVPALSAGAYVDTITEITSIPDAGLRATLLQHATLGGSATTSNVSAEIVKRAEGSEFLPTEGAVVALGAVMTVEGKPVAWKWDEITKALGAAAHLDTASGEADEIAAAVRTLLGLQGVPAAAAHASEALAALVPGPLLRQFSKVRKSPGSAGPILAALLARCEKVQAPDSTAAATAATAEWTAGHDAYKSVAANPEAHADLLDPFVASAPLHTLRVIARRHGYSRSRRLAVDVLHRIALREDEAAVFDIDTLTRNGDVLAGLLGDLYSTLVRRRLEENNDPLAIPVGLWNLRPAAYLAVTSALDGDGSSAYRTSVLEAYQALRQDEWAEVITDWPSALRLAVHLADEGHALSTGADLADALRAHIEAVVAGDRDPGVVPEETPRLYLLLPERTKEGFLSRLRQIVLDGKLEALRVALDGPYGADLARAEGWGRVADRAMGEFLPEVVGHGRGNEVAWVADLLTQSPDVITEADQGLCSELSDRANSRFGKAKATGVVKDGLTKVFKALSPHLPRKRRQQGPIASVLDGLTAVLFGSSTPVRRGRSQNGDAQRPKGDSGASAEGEASAGDEPETDG